MTKNDLIKIRAAYAHTLFPKYPKVLGEEGNNYGVVKWRVLEVLEGDVPDDEIIISGTYFTPISREAEYTISAKETEHQKYGKQFQMVWYGEFVELKTIKSQKAFMKTFLTDNQINEMFKLYENPVELIANHDVEALKKVHGVGDYIAGAIIRRYEECKDNSVIYSELCDYNLTPTFIQKLIGYYKSPQAVIDVVKNHPYQLCQDISGIGFKKADEIALAKSKNYKSVERIGAYIYNKLSELGENGDSYITSGELQYYLNNELGAKESVLEIIQDDSGNTTNNIALALKNLTDKNVITIKYNENKAARRVYLNKYYNLEKDIAYHLKRIFNAPNNFEYPDWQENVKQQENIQGWELTPEQLTGVESCLNNQITFITGGAGTGKTSVLSTALKAMDCLGKNDKYSFVQCSLSGKAAARMTEVTGAEGYTIHRLLGYKPGEGFKYKEDNPLPHDIIIVDEISLIGGEIFLSLLKAIKTGSKLIILGDMGQLESIGCLNLAKDLYDNTLIPVIELKKIHRQAQKSGIITLSQQIRNYDPSNLRQPGERVIGELQDMRLVIEKDKDNIRNIAMKYYKQYFDDNPGLSPMDIQILSPLKERGESSVYHLNQEAQEFLNPHTKFCPKPFIDCAHGKKFPFQIRQDDKVMCIKNNYELYAVCTNESEGTYNYLYDEFVKPVAVFNGWTGNVTKIDKQRGILHVHFPIINESVIFRLDGIEAYLILGYASTVHKFQGSSAKFIVGVMDYNTPPYMRSKEMLYTMLTRAEKHCTLVGQSGACVEAAERSGIEDKNTFLCEMLNG